MRSSSFPLNTLVISLLLNVLAISYWGMLFAQEPQPEVVYVETFTPLSEPNQGSEGSMKPDSALYKSPPAPRPFRDNHFFSFRATSEFPMGEMQSALYNDMGFGIELAYARRILKTPFVAGVDLGYTHLGNNHITLPSDNWRNDYFFTPEEMSDSYKPGYVESRLNTHWMKSMLTVGWQPIPHYEIAKVPYLLFNMGYMHTYSYHDYTKQAIIHRPMRTILPHANYFLIGGQTGMKVMVDQYFIGFGVGYWTSLNEQALPEMHSFDRDVNDNAEIMLTNSRLSLLSFRFHLGVHW